MGIKLLALALLASCAGAQILTTIQDTVMASNGMPFSGRVTAVSTTPGALPTSTPIFNGALSIQVPPNPTGTNYTATFTSSNGLSSWTETWLVPASANALKLADVRVSTAAGSGSTIQIAPSQMPAFSGDISTPVGSTVATLATVNAEPGACGDATHVCGLTTNAKGLVTAQAPVAISGVGGGTPAGADSAVEFNNAGAFGGDASNFSYNAQTHTLTTFNLTIGGICAGCPSGGFANPMTAAGDLIAAGAAGAAQRIPAGADGTVLTMTSGAPAWTMPAGIGASQASSPARALRTAYQNTTGELMLVEVTDNAPGGTGSTWAMVDANASPTTWVAEMTNSAAYERPLFFVVPPGDYYEVDYDTPATLQNWIEWTLTGSGGGGGAGGITQLTGDVSTPAGSGPQAATLATVNGNVGTFGNSTTIPILTVDGKGRVTAVSTVAAAGGGGGGGIAAGPLNVIPSQCSVGTLYFATDQPAGQQIYTCSTTNIWTQFLTVGTSGALAIVNGSLDIVTSVVPRLESANTFTGLNTFAQDPIYATSATPASAGAPCTTGQHAWDANYEYRCIATNTWKRTALASW